MSQEVNTVMLSREVYDDFVDAVKKLEALKESAQVGLLTKFHHRSMENITVVVGAEEVYAAIDKKVLLELKLATEHVGMLERLLQRKEETTRTPRSKWWDVFSKFKEKSE